MYLLILLPTPSDFVAVICTRTFGPLLHTAIKTNVTARFVLTSGYCFHAKICWTSAHRRFEASTGLYRRNYSFARISVGYNSTWPQLSNIYRSYIPERLSARSYLKPSTTFYAIDYRYLTIVEHITAQLSASS